MKADIEKIKFYFSVSNSGEKLDAMQQIKFAAAKEILKKYSITSEEDVDSLLHRQKLIPMYVTNLKQEISAEQLKLGRISEVMNTYEKIVGGGYIDSLIAAERERIFKENAIADKKQSL